MASHDSRTINRGIAWIGLASTLVGMLDVLAIFIILRHWISPAEYGVAALIITIFPILDLATDMGMGSAVIQAETLTDDTVSTVFWLNLAMSLVLFGLLLLLAPLLGRLQDHPIVGTGLIVYGTKLIWQNVYSIPSAMMKRELRFKELSIIRILANCAEFCAKVGFAAAGFHIWCFILGSMCRVLVTGIGCQLRHPWRPKFVLKLREAKSYATYGLKTSASQILFFFYTNVDYQVVAYYFGDTANGLYRAAYELVLEPVRIMSTVIVEVAFPLFSRLRTRRAQLIEQFIAFTRQNLVVVLPFIALVLLAAEEMIGFFIGSHWVAAAHAARILCIVGVFRALSFVVPPLLDGIGYPATTLIYTLVASIVLPTMYITFAAFLGPRLGYVSVAWAWAAGYPIAFFVLSWLAMHRIGLGALNYLKRVMGIPACTLVAMGAGWGARWLASPLLPSVRFAVIAVVTLGVLGVLLAYFQGISPRSVRASLASGPPENEAPPPVA